MTTRRLTIVCGPPGAGKSTHARALAATTGAALLELDTLSEPIVQAALRALGRDPDDRDSPFYKETFRGPIYEALLATAAENLAQTDVIVVGPFTRELARPDWPQTLEQRFGVAVEVHFVTCPEAMRRARLAGRANPRDAAKLEAWSNHERYYEAARQPAFPCRMIESGG